MLLNVYILATLSYVTCTYAVTLNWAATWVSANPDGMKVRPVIGINGQFPPPAIKATVGEQVTLTLTNQLGNETTGMHFHGLFQKGTNPSDGPTGTTQCPIGPGESFTYSFTIQQPGTYWYHSHNRGQYPDGFRGPLLITDPQNPYAHQIDDELVLTVSDWYHLQVPELIGPFLSITANPEGAEPIPNGAILNDNATTSFNLTPGKTYMTRIINMSTFASFLVKFDQHQMTIIEVDGVYTVAQKGQDVVYLTAGQRMSVLITAKQSTNQNYAFIGAMDPTMFDCFPDCPNPLNATGYLVYNSYKPLPANPPTISSYTSGFFDDFNLVPYDHTPLFQPVTHQITLNVESGVFFNQNRFAINNNTFIEPLVPSLYTALSTGSSATNPLVYGQYANAFVLNHMDVVEVVINNYDEGGHPVHMHGHNFQMVQRSPASAPNAAPYPGHPVGPVPPFPMRRDVMKVYGLGYLVYRFVADNPGVWAFHCHIDWHLGAGFFATIVEAPLLLQKTEWVPQDMYNVCKEQGLPYQGNAAGNTKNFTDLTGANDAPPVNNVGALIT